MTSKHPNGVGVYRLLQTQSSRREMSLELILWDTVQQR
jgi:hypothetical protein